MNVVRGTTCKRDHHHIAFLPGLPTKTIESKRDFRHTSDIISNHRATAILHLKMKSFFSVAAVTALFAATNVMALERTAQGCFSSSTGMTLNSTQEYNSRGSCGDQCYAINSATFAMTDRNLCYCGDVLPPSSTKVNDSKCNINCPGFGSESCKYTASELISTC